MVPSQYVNLSNMHLLPQQLKNLPFTGAELVEEGLLDLAGLLQLCVLPCGLLAHLTVQHGLSRNMYISISRLQCYGYISEQFLFS